MLAQAFLDSKSPRLYHLWAAFTPLSVNVADTGKKMQKCSDDRNSQNFIWVLFLLCLRR
jgi:hypothetical protein